MKRRVLVRRHLRIGRLVRAHVRVSSYNNTVHPIGSQNKRMHSKREWTDEEFVEDMAEDAKVAAEFEIKKLGIEPIGAKLIGSFGVKQLSAKDIDVLVKVKNIDDLKGKRIINTDVSGKPLDVFVEDEKGKKGVFVDTGFYGVFDEI